MKQRLINAWKRSLRPGIRFLSQMDYFIKNQILYVHLDLLQALRKEINDGTETLLW